MADGEGKYEVVDHDTAKVLKGKSVQMSNIYSPKEFAEAARMTDTGSPRPLLQLGAERITFLSKILDPPTSWSACAIMLLTPENLNALQEGIAADRSGG